MTSLNMTPNGSSPLPEFSAKAAMDATACDQLRDLIPAYSIGATDPQETAFVEAMLPRCPEMALELTEYLLLADQFLYVPAASRTAPARFDPMPVLPPVISTKSPVRVMPPARHRSPRPAPVRVDARLWAVAAVVTLLLFGGMTVYWMAQVQRLEENQQVLALQLQAATNDRLVSTTTQVQYRDLLPNQDTQVSEEAHATLIWNAADETGSLYVSGLPTLPANKAYQLWVVREGHSLSLGTFALDASGVGALVFHASEPINEFQHIGISEEPSAGSAAPTTPHLVLGTI